jgi:hypothetical protein
MPITDSLQQQAQLLFEQRLNMQNERYVTWPQILRHDYQLIDCLQLLGTCPDPQRAPGWLNWLLGAECSTLKLSDVMQCSQPEAAWLLLYELKALSHGEQVQQSMQQLIAQRSALQALAWQFAWRQQQLAAEVELSEMTDVNALWYLGCRGNPEPLPSLRAFLAQLTPEHPLHVHVRLAAYLLGDKADVVKLTVSLNEANALHPVALMLLLVSASDVMQGQIINYLATLDNATLAIAAMGYSGQLKFVPLLLELAQQHDASAQARAALSLLLGVVDADSLLGANDVALLLQGKAGRKLAGAVINQQQLDRVVRQGNPAQRQLAACYQFVAQPGTALRHSCALLGGATQ